jgi:predicted nucleic acid-binding protein
MILADTSVWIDHLRRPDADLNRLISTYSLLGHPFVTGEIAMGSLRNRARILGVLQRLGQMPVAREHEVLQFVEVHGLFGTGLSYIDVHLLAATRQVPGALLWTRDKRLLAASSRFGVAAIHLH